MYFLDSDVVIDMLRGYPPAADWLASIGTEEILLPGFVVLEILQGSRNQHELRRVTRFLEPFAVDWPREATFYDTVSIFGRLHLSHGTGILDALIGHMALARELPLCTFNVKHYAGIPYLETVQPYDRIDRI